MQQALAEFSVLQADTSSEVSAGQVSWMNSVWAISRKSVQESCVAVVCLGQLYNHL